MILLFALSTSALATEYVIPPGDPWCDVLNAAAPGDTVILQSGDHAGPCAITNGGTEGAPVTVRGGDPAAPPQIVYAGANSNILDIVADYVTIAGLALGPSRPDIDGIKIKEGSYAVIEDNRFTGIGGISVSANSADSVGITIRHNRFTDLEGTALYLGCHDGAGSCAATDLLVEGNLIDGVSSSDVGYGIEVKKDSWGRVADNVIVDTQGPGIEMFGSEDAAAASTVDGNLVVGSRNNGSIEVGGPYVTVTNNIVVGGGDGGICVYAYWDSVHDVIVAGNTLVGDSAAAVRVASETTASRLVDNLAWQTNGSSPFPGPMGGLTAAGNITCTSAAACWVDEAAWDFWPVDGSAATTSRVTEVTLDHDFCGRSRADPPTVGAIEWTTLGGPGPLAVDFKSTFGCPEDETTTDTGPTDTNPTDTSTPGDDSGPADTSPDDDSAAGTKDGAARGCTTTAGPGAVAAGLIAMLLIARRRV